MIQSCTKTAEMNLHWISSIKFYLILYKKVKLATIVEGDSKAPFSIAYYTKV